jgi:hypothetical protein
MESPISISQQHRPISGKELQEVCVSVSANGFSFKHVDRLALAASMSTNEFQANSLVTLKIGEAAVHSIGDDYPFLVKMDLVKDLPNTTLPTSFELKRLMSESVIPNKYKEILLLHPALNRIENEPLYETIEVVRTILENPEL